MNNINAIYEILTFLKKFAVRPPKIFLLWMSLIITTAIVRRIKDVEERGRTYL